MNDNEFAALKKALDGVGSPSAQTIVEQSALRVHPLDWTELVSPEVAAKLQAENFKSASPPDAVVLFLTTIVHHKLIHVVTGTGTPLPDVFAKKIAPALEKIDRNFEILGNLALPSYFQLAVAELSQPFAVYCFPVIRAVPDLAQKLADLGLDRTTVQCDVETLGRYES